MYDPNWSYAYSMHMYAYDQTHRNINAGCWTESYSMTPHRDAQVLLGIRASWVGPRQPWASVWAGRCKSSSSQWVDHQFVMGWFHSPSFCDLRNQVSEFNFIRHPAAIPAWLLDPRSKVTLALKELWVAKQSAQQDGPLVLGEGQGMLWTDGGVSVWRLLCTFVCNIDF